MVDPRRKFYDTIAEEFDAIMDPYDLRRRLEAVFDLLLRGTDLGGASLLDAGCGTGFFSLWAQQRGARVTSIDLGTRLLRVARRKGLGRLATADAACLPFATASFDMVISSECIEHTPSPAHTVGDLCRVLRPGGRIVLTCPNRFWYWSCVLANALGLRRYAGLENWPGWWALRRWLRDGQIRIEHHRGLHLFPFVWPACHPLLERLDAAGRRLGPLYLNQCIKGIKEPEPG